MNSSTTLVAVELVHVPERPGLGMTIDLEAARRYLVPVEIRVGGEMVYETPELRE